MGVAKILKKSGTVRRIITTDIHHEHPGKLISDMSIIIERADSDKYFLVLKKLIEEFSVDLIIPTSELEIRAFYRENILEDINNIPIILANKKSLEVGLDKYKTYQILKSIDLPYPWTKMVSEEPPLETPCIIKSRYGSGSANVELVSEELIPFYSKNRPDDIWQELLLPTEEEYTCGLYGLNNGDIRIIVFRRKLTGGISIYGEVIENPEIEEILKKLALNLNLKGSINVQLKMTTKGPVIFEINPRFSSTLVFRDLLGFKDLIWSLYEKKGFSPEDYHPPNKGIKFFRGSREYVF